jgi:hypothetical protein
MSYEPQRYQRINPADYDRWLERGPGGPNDPVNDEELTEEELEERQRRSEEAAHDAAEDQLRD